MPSEEKLWVDCLLEKHECYTYDRYATTREVEYDGRSYRIVLPDHLPSFEVVHAVEQGDLLSLFGRDERTLRKDEYLGVLAVARRQADGTFVVHIWHELYPWALKYLGLEQNDAS